MMTESSLSNAPSIAEVQAAFARWRERGVPRRTPDRLRQQAVALLSEHGISEVMQALRLDHRRLSRWRRTLLGLSETNRGGGFVELPATGDETSAVLAAGRETATLTLTRQASDGQSVSIAGELALAQWRWALQLLDEAAL